MKKTLLYMTLLGLVSLANAAQRPNLLLILSDDQGFGQLGCFSDLFTVDQLPQESVQAMEPKILSKYIQAGKDCTPELDKLAENGIRVTNLLAGHTCAPSRMMLMTANYPQRSGVYTNLDMNDIGAPKDLHYLVKDLKKSGYRTALVGKWHLGLNPGQHPLDKGFDTFFGFDAPGSEKYDSKTLFRGRESAAAEGYLCDQMTGEALQFLEKDSDEPFFLYLAYNEPHGPLPKPPEAYLKPFHLRPKANNFFGAIYAMDHGIGRIVEQLKATGRLDNTLIVFASDNGAVAGAPLPRNGAHKGGKRMVYDGGRKVPMIIHYPAMISGARDYTENLCIGDVMPTMLDCAGVKVPKGLDGRSFRCVLEGSSEPVHPEAVFWASESKILTPDAEAAAKKWTAENKKKPAGERRWHSGGLPATWSAHQGDWKAMKAEGYPLWLFNVAKDPGETTDVAASHPEICAELLKQYKAWFNQQAKPVMYYTDKWNALKPE